MDSVGNKMKELGDKADMTPSGIWRLFVQQTRANLHVVLCMSPIGDAFRTRLRKFPSIINCCTIDWFSAWPQDALQTVAESFLREVQVDDDDVHAAITSMCTFFQESVVELSTDFYAELRRQNYVTPTSYLELLGAFRSLLDVKRGELTQSKSRYDVGLKKLKDTSEQVQTMQAELIELQPKLVQAKADADELMVKIEGDSKAAEETRIVVEKDEAAATIKANEARAIKEECEEGLAEALPALEAAVKALRTLKKDDITEVKSMKSPPAGVKLTMEAVCIMKEVPPVKVAAPDGRGKVDDFWEPSKKMLNDSKFLQSLMDYDKDNIKPEVIHKIQAYVSNPDFDPELVKKATTRSRIPSPPSPPSSSSSSAHAPTHPRPPSQASKAAHGLCCWVRAMEVYNRVAKVRPRVDAHAERSIAFLNIRSNSIALHGLMDGFLND